MIKKGLSLVLVLVFAITAVPLVGLTEAKSADWQDVLSYEEDYEGTEITITSCDEFASGSLVIPATIDGLPVTSIDWYAFYDCSKLTSVTIPDSVTSIGESAFEECSSLTNITIPDSVKSIGDWAFYGCSSLTSVTIPDSVKSIGEGVFYYTAYYNNASNWQNGVLYIGKYLIAADEEEVSGTYTVKAGTLCIAGGAFIYCRSLTFVSIPDGVTSIGSYAFYDCTSLKNVVIPKTVQSVGDEAFAMGFSGSITDITVPSDISKFGDEVFTVFYGSSSVTTIKSGDFSWNYDGTLSEDSSSYDSSDTLDFDKLPTQNVKNVYVYNPKVQIIGNVENEDAVIHGFGCSTAESYANTNGYAFIEISNVTALAVKTNPTQTSYFVGDTLDTTGLSLTATYNDGSTQTVTTGFTCSPMTLTTVGTETITVTYQGKTTTFDVTVMEVPVSAITLDATSANIIIGETKQITATISPSNATNQAVTWTSSNTSVATVSVNGLVTAKAVGKATITCKTKDGGKTTTCAVTVVAVTLDSIAVETVPTKTSYYVGETLDTTGLTLTATFNNGTTETVTTGFTCSPETLTTDGMQTITVTYDGKTTTFNVTITAVTLCSIAVKTNPTKTSYFVGDTLDTTGLTLTATYNNGTTQTITSGFTCSPTILNTVGTRTITVTYQDKTTTFDIPITAVTLSSIDVKTNPTKTSYFVGDTLDTAGLTLTATYNNGTTETGTTGFTCSLTTLTTAGTQVVTVTYDGKTTTFNVTVTAVTLSGIAVKTAPTKTSYFVGDTLDTAGLSLTATYNNGYTETVYIGYTCSLTTLSTAGTQTITVTYSGKTTTFNVTVTAVALSSIAVKTNPTITSYYVGDTLDTAGLSLTATYNNGTTRIISSGFTCSPTKFSTAGTQKITVTYQGKTTAFKATVKAVPVSSVKLNATSANVTIGATKQLTATVTPSNATNKNVTWTSSNANIATVSASGLVTAKAAGKATITCKAKDGSGKNATCTVTVIPKTPTVIPKTPTGVKAASASYNSIKISWTAVSGATGYAVYRATSKTGTYSFFKSTTSTSLTDTSRTTGTTYYYKIKAYKTVGNNKYYSEFSAIGSAKAVPAVPASFTAAKASTTSVKTSWKAVTGATGYEVWMATSSSGTYSKITTSAKTTYTKTKLTKNKAYYFKVRAYTTVGSTKVYGAFTAVKSAKPS